MSLVRSRQARLPAMELVLGARSGKFPVAPQPDHDISAAAEHRMNLAVRHLQAIGCRASGLLSDEDLVKAVHSETRRHEYDNVILATGREGGRWLPRALRLDPVHRLRRRMGQRLIIFPARPGHTALQELTVSLSALAAWPSPLPGPLICTAGGSPSGLGGSRRCCHNCCQTIGSLSDHLGGPPHQSDGRQAAIVALRQWPLRSPTDQCIGHMAGTAF